MKRRSPYPAAAPSTRRLAAAIAAVFVATHGAAVFAAPAVINCNPTGSGSLAAAVAGASPNDVINMEGLTCSKITLASALLVGTPNLTLQGLGTTFLTITSADSRVIYDQSGGLTIQDMTIVSTNPGSALSMGGCIAASGDLTMRRVAVSNCHLSNDNELGITQGGAIYVGGNLTMSDVRVTGSSINAGFARGGAIAVLGNADIAYTIISSNTVATKSNAIVRTGGGGLFVDGTLTLKTSVISGNSATSAGQNVVGGGLYVGASTGGAMTPYAYLQFDELSRNTVSSTFDGTRNDVRGGGFYAKKFSGLVYSTVDHNSSNGVGGGIATDMNAKLNVTQSTIAYNVAAFNGGAFFTDYSHTMRILNSTIADNYSNSIGQCAGLFFNQGGSLLAVSTIVANNRKYTSPNTPCDIQAANGASFTISGSNDLITDQSGLSVPSGTLSDDPQLFPLAVNGGPTLTMGIAASSPARLVGLNVFNLSFDQRGGGYPRTIDNNTDIGAFEVRFAGDGDTIFQNGFELPVIN